MEREPNKADARVRDVPAELAHLPVHSGLPVPFVTGTWPDGRPDFRKTHVKNHTLAQRYQLCGICGKHISAPPYVFGVGPLTLEARMVFEPPMHLGCARAALTLCPFLARKNWQRAENLRPGSIRAYELHELPPKPDRPGLAFVPSYQPVQNPDNGMWYAQLPRAEFPVEWWCYVDGVLTPESGCVVTTAASDPL